jgi:integral membrane protein (TIGR01906 family)
MRATSTSPDKKTLLQGLLVAATALALALTLIGSAFHVVLNFGIAHAIAEETVDTANSAVGHDELVAIADMTLRYVCGDTSVNFPRGVDDRVAYTDDIIAHLDDVTAFISTVRNTTLICIPLLVVFLLIQYGVTRGSGMFKRLLGWTLLVGGALPALLVLVIGIGCIIDFYTMFNFLHGFIFKAGSWYFSYSSLLICALPESYWIDMAMVLLGSLALMCCLCMAAGVLLIRRWRRRMVSMLV